jgi:cysteinyl-tRNA synthetase
MSEISTGIKIFDTQSRVNKEITLSNGEYARMYCCGPTVYRDAHVGNLRTFLLSDLIAKLILINGFKVKVIQNITSIFKLIYKFYDKKYLKLITPFVS